MNYFSTKLGIAVLLLNVLMCHSAWARGAYAQISETKVINYVPAMPKKPVEKGGCWNTSVRAPRFGAWACVAGKKAYDPCFSVPNVTNAVVCGANPALNEAGLRLELVQALPFQQGIPPVSDEAWLMQLANGLICTAALGPEMIVQNKGIIAYACDEPGLPEGVHAGVFRALEVGTVWNAHFVHYVVKKGNYEAKDIQQIPIMTVWQ
ncbi:MAG: hypothetical protein HY939_07385 [Gammaproteobacteria bacterium]|nr:hypothetical protein [Gammaproteobacteria bacterium]